MKKKGNVEGTAFSYQIQTVDDVLLEDIRICFLSLQDWKRKKLYTVQALVFDRSQLIPSEYAVFDHDIISATNMIRKKYNWKHFNLGLKPIDSVDISQDGNYGWANACIQNNFWEYCN